MYTRPKYQEEAYIKMHPNLTLRGIKAIAIIRVGAIFWLAAIFGGPAAFGQVSEGFEVEITPMISRLELRDGEKVIWSTQSQNDQPNRYGQSPYSKEDYIKQRERAIPEFFSGLQIPVRIPRPPYTYGLGSRYALNILWHNRSSVQQMDEQANTVSVSPKASATPITTTPPNAEALKKHVTAPPPFAISSKRPPGMPTPLRTSGLLI